MFRRTQPVESDNDMIVLAGIAREQQSRARQFAQVREQHHEGRAAWASVVDPLISDHAEDFEQRRERDLGVFARSLQLLASEHAILGEERV